MSGQRHRRLLQSKSALIAGALVAFALIVVLVIAASYTSRTLTEIRRLQAATSDNVQWTMPQVEVEFLHLQHALDTRDANGNPDLNQIRLRYDVLYSRVQTLRRSPMYDALSSQQAFERSLKAVVAFMDRAIPLVDGSDAQLEANLDRFSEAASVVRRHVRTLSVSGLSYFARQTDLRREQVSTTLIQLAVITGVLFIALAAISLFLFFVYRLTAERGTALSQANERMNTILSTSLDGVIVTDGHGRILEFNEAAQTIFGRSEEEVLGKTVGEILFAYRDRAPISGHIYRQFVGLGRTQQTGLRSDGSEFPIEFALQSATHDNQMIFIGFLRDISERVENQKQLVKARDRALAGEKAKTEFLTVMSHEIRTPLNGLLGNLSLLEDTAPNEQQSVYLRNMEVSGRILMDHVDSILDISRFDAGKLEITSATLNLDTLLDDLVAGVGSMAQTQETEIAWHWTSAAHPWVKADGQRLQQVLMNLVGNALKFTRRGRVTVEVELLGSAPKNVHGSDLIEFRVCDTGIGIPEDSLGRIFDDFHTRDSSFKRLQGGTGLGLGIARRLVEAMGGKIGVESIPGTGSTFWIRLPVTLTDAKKDEATTSDDHDSVPQMRILVVEDNAINRQVAEAMLAREGHIVACATNGQEGIDMARDGDYDLILMDISMPVMDGLEATRHIRKSKGKSASVPVIALSANVLPQDKDRFLAAGMDAFLGKPLRQEDLRAALAALQIDRPDPPAQQTQAETNEPDAQPVTATVLDFSQLNGMRDSLPPAAFEALLSRFIREGDALADQLGSFDPAETDFEDLSKLCHKIAGSAAVFGAGKYRENLQNLEQAALHEPDFIRDILPDLLESWSKTRVSLCDLEAA